MKFLLIPKNLLREYISVPASELAGKFKIIFDDYINCTYYHMLEKFFEIETFERFGVATKLKKNLNIDDFI